MRAGWSRAPMSTGCSTRRSHPYTRGLLASLPVVDHAVRAGARRDRLKAIPGQVADPRHPPPGCAFAPRCGLAAPACAVAMPPVERVGGRPCLALPAVEGAVTRHAAAARGHGLKVISRSARACSAGAARSRAVDGVSLDIRPRRDAGPGRRIRLRQDHHRPRRPAPDRADRRARAASTGGTSLGLRRSRDARAAQPDADHLPGPLCQPEPAR